MISPPALTLSKRRRKITLVTEGRDHQVDCVRLQKLEDGENRPVGYWSCTLGDPKKNLDTTHREFLAAVWAVLILRLYLEGTKFIIRSNQHALGWVPNHADATGKLARWRL